MRVCELAQLLKVGSTDLLREAAALGLDLHSPLARLDDDEARALRERVGAEAAAGRRQAAAARLAEKRARAAASRAAREEQERLALAAAVARAKEIEARLQGAAAAEAAAAPSPAPPEIGSAAADEARVVIHAAAAGEEGAAAAPAPPAEDLQTPAPAEEQTRAPAEEQVDPDEEIASAYLGRKAQEALPPRAHPQRPREKEREKEKGTPRAAPRGGVVRPAAARGGRTAAAPAARPAVPGARPRPAPGRPASAGPSRFAPVTPAAPAADRVLLLRGPTVVKELAEMMNVRPNRIIADLMQLNVLASINQRVDLEMARRIAEKYGYKVELERVRRLAERKPVIRRLDEEDDIPEDRPEDMLPRPPVVTFLGHVDHGKTTLMDRIRQTQVASGEAGGITQHIGAYSVEVGGRRITFLDTPGHAAFSAMRARGATLTDLAVIVIAADDGIMPQTREVIRQARQAGVQMLVAINKCDLPTARPDRVRQQLQSEGLTPEEWGGDLVVCEVSAATGKGIEHLLEMILLQADMLELRANPGRRADGYVIEAQLELGLGPTATLLVSSGTLKVGDVVLVGEHFGRLRGLMDDRGRKVKSAGPATAVRVMGLSGVPEAGAEFRVMVNEKRARELAEKHARERKDAELAAASKPAATFDGLLDQLKERQRRQLNLIVKADTQGSAEAIVDSLREIRSEKIGLEIVSSAIGDVTLNDIQRAAAADAMIVGFQVGLDAGVAAQARHNNVRVHTFRIIYELFDHVRQTMLDMLEPEYREVVLGHAQVRAIFDLGRKGKIAGCQMLDGALRGDARVRVKRLRDVVFDGRILSLRHFQEEVREVREAQECGIRFQDFEGFAEGDIVESYILEELERTL
jgi:translation initiation factor IF-2